MADPEEPLRIGAVLDWLSQGQMDGKHAGSRMRTIKFPAPEEPSVAERFTHDAHGEAALHDPASDPASFAAVSHAHAAGKLDRTQYEHLAAGAAEAMRGAV